METANRYARDRTTRQRLVVVNSIMKTRLWKLGVLSLLSREELRLVVLLLVANGNKFWISRYEEIDVVVNSIVKRDYGNLEFLASFARDVLSFYY